MHNFVQNRSKCNQFFLLLFFYSVTLSGMEASVVFNRRFRQPDSILSIFDPKKEMKKGTLWSNVVPGIIKITPDGNGVVIGQHGVIKYALFDQQCAPKTIIEHPCAKEYIPMIAMSQRKDGSGLLIVSACNYKKPEKSYVSEYILFCGGAFKLQKLDWFIQAISSDACGKMLAVAGQHSVTVVDIETNKISETSFKCLANSENWITDIAMSPEGEAVIAAGNYGSIQWMSLSRDNGDIVLSNLKQVVVKDDIKNIYYPDRNQLLYVTHNGQVNGQVKRITTDDLRMTNSENIVTTDFADLSVGDIFLADSSIIAKVFAPKDKRLQQETVSIIEVLRKGNEQDEKFILEVPSLYDRYNYITKLGQCALGIGHLLHVTVRANVVVGLATDGNMRVWHLPGNNVICNEVNNNLELNAIAFAKEIKTQGECSGSQKGNKHNLSSSGEDENGEKKFFRGA